MFCPFTKLLNLTAQGDDLADIFIFQPTPAFGDFSKDRALASLPGDSSNQSMKRDDAQIVQKLSELQWPLWQISCLLIPTGFVLTLFRMFRRTVCRPTVADRLGADNFFLFKILLHGLMGLIQILKKPLLFDFCRRTRDSKTIGMNDLGFFAVC